LVQAINLGMARIGGRRELKRGLEAYWKGIADADWVRSVARGRRLENWNQQASSGIGGIASGEFSLYDHVLDTCAVVSAIPERFANLGHLSELDRYFALARGAQVGEHAVRPLEMTKWFDTNYHYLVPEVGPDTEFALMWRKHLDEYTEARALGFETRPVVLGPVSFLLLAKSTTPGFAPLELLPRLLPVYRQLLAELGEAGASWIQIDEPALVTDHFDDGAAAYRRAFEALAGASGARLLLATYFGALGDAAELVTSLPVDAIHVDASRGRDELAAVAGMLDPAVTLSAGVVDGRNVWRTDLRSVIADLEPIRDQLGPDRLWVAPSCSLLHVPVDLDAEGDGVIDPELRSWMAFGRQKLDEVVTVATGLAAGRDAVAEVLAISDAAAASRRGSGRVHADGVRRRLAAFAGRDSHRSSPYEVRRARRTGSARRPLLPTTTIGSFPQTREVRRNRQQYIAGEISETAYREACEAEITRVVREQERLGVDVLVHGEAERDDMVQYFAEHLRGFVSTEQGWVQSYGTRCVRPPIIYGDVERPAPITRTWIEFAQSLTERPMKGMLTGPVTMLKWSFVRDDQPAAETCRQIALAIRDEVEDLEAAGIGVIQVDEPALREGLPLRRADQPEYLAWATECFRLTTTSVTDETEIHTHMCYVELGDLLDALRDLEVDAISIEAARSAMAVVDDLGSARLSCEVGPGVWDIHAPLVPSVEEIVANIERALEHVPAERLWINPDCGLKTRTWDEVVPALDHLVGAAAVVRSRLGAGTDGATEGVAPR
jgi:5-methyltetrahydropteroyltriglutamate--homocysteine methyltransferase